MSPLVRIDGVMFVEAETLAPVEALCVTGE